MKMFSEIKVGEYTGSIEDFVKKQPYNFTKTNIGRKEIPKYTSIIRYEKSFFNIMLSKAPDSYRNKDFNITVTVIGTEEESVKNMMKTIQKNSGIEFKEAPEFVKNKARFFKKYSSRFLETSS